MRRLLALLYDSPHRQRLLLLGLSGALAVYVGFVAVPVPVAEDLIQHWGYYYILAVFTGFCACLYALFKDRQAVWKGWLRRPGIVGLTLVFACLFTYWADPFKHKILFDEYVLQGTAYHMHATKEVGAIVRAYDVNGSWISLDAFLDKRPYFFAFLVSLMHDLTGYRLANIFVVNALLAPVFIGAMYWLGLQVSGKGPALFAVLLMCTMPLTCQNVSCAGMELHNLTMIATVMILSVLYLRRPDELRLSLVVIGAVLLSQSRYESVIFVVPAALVVVLGWLRAGRVFVSWWAVVAPLLLIPYAWHNRVLSASPLLWQLRDGQTARFSLSYLKGNLQGAYTFFFNTAPLIANSWYLSVVGVLGILYAGYRLVRWLRAGSRAAWDEPTQVVALFGLGIAGNLTLLMFYYWSRLDDVIASRFALPMCFLLCLLGAVLVQGLREWRLPGLRLAFAGLVAWVLGWDLKAIAAKEYTSKNLVMQEIDWEHDFLASRKGPVLFISNMSTMPFILWHIPSIVTYLAPGRAAQLEYHLKEKTFSEIIVAQALRATTPDGDLGLDPSDVLPPNFKLEPITIQRFGHRWTKFSRLVDITEPDKVELKAPLDVIKAAKASHG